MKNEKKNKRVNTLEDKVKKLCIMIYGRGNAKNLERKMKCFK